jgi:hypothetical protein
VRCPLLVLVCDQDQSALAGPASARRTAPHLAKLLPHGQLVEVEDSYTLVPRASTP